MCNKWLLLYNFIIVILANSFWVYDVPRAVLLYISYSINFGKTTRGSWSSDSLSEMQKILWPVRSRSVIRNQDYLTVKSVLYCCDSALLQICMEDDYLLSSCLEQNSVLFTWWVFIECLSPVRHLENYRDDWDPVFVIKVFTLK